MSLPSSPPSTPSCDLSPAQRAAVGRSDLLRELPQGVLDELLLSMCATRLAPGAPLFASGLAGHRLWVVLEGRVAVTTPRRDRLLALMQPGDLIGEVQVFDPAPWAFAATAMSRVLVVSARREDVLDWVARHPAVSAHLLQRMARQLAVKSRAAHEPQASDAAARVAREVLALADRCTVHGVVQHGLTQQQLADIVGVSRERVNKVLSDFCDRGWIVVGRGLLTVLDRDALQAQAHHQSTAPAVGMLAARGTA